MRASCIGALTVGLVVLAAALAEEEDKPSPLPAAVVAAWKNVGADVGWMRRNDKGYLEFRLDKEGKAGEVPSFRFDAWNEGVIGRLPPPKRGFGLCLTATQLTNPGLKDLSGLKNLELLDLSFTDLTGAGLKALLPLKNLQSLDISNTQIADAGPKELAGLTNLRSLNLASTRVTDAGLKDLARLKNLQSLTLTFTKVTDAGVAELQKALPKLTVVR